MAKIGVQIVGDATSLTRAFRQAGSEGRRFGRTMQRTSRETTRTTSAFGGLSKGVLAGVGVTAGLAGLAAGLRDVVSAAMESQKIQKQLQAQLRASGISYKRNAGDIERVVAAQSQMAAVDDEIVKSSLTSLIRSTGSLSKAMKDNALALDIAAGAHVGLNTAAKLLGKVEQGNINAFSRYGVVVKKGASVTEALAAIQQKFKGQAAAAGSTAQGAFQRFHIAVENLKEAIGTGLLPVVTRAANWIGRRLADPAVQKRIEDLSRAFGEKLMGALRGIGGWVSAHGDEIKAVWGFVASSLAAGASAAKLLVAALKPIVSIVPSDKLLLALGVLYGANKIGGLPIPGRGGGKVAGGGRRRIPNVGGGVKSGVVIGGGLSIVGDVLADATNRGPANAKERRIFDLAQTGDAGAAVSLAKTLGYTLTLPQARALKGMDYRYGLIPGSEGPANPVRSQIASKIANWQKMGATFMQDMSGTIRATGSAGQVFHTFAPGAAGYGMAAQNVHIEHLVVQADSADQLLESIRRKTRTMPRQQRGRTSSGNPVT